MNISFFEEFPSRQNLEKLTLVSWPSKLYLAARSLREFTAVVGRIKRKNIRTFIYWPVLERKEGYWISPFSQRKALKRIFRELGGRRIPVMLDLELPTTQNPLLYLTQAFSFIANKRLIRQFIQNYRGAIYLAEYYPEGKWKERMLQFLGLHYPSFPRASPSVKIIKMLYHSLHPFKEEYVKQELKRGRSEHQKNFLVAYGTMGTGIQRTEPNITFEQLARDLQLAQQAGIGEVIIYRLGGLQTRYATCLQKFSRK